MTQAASHDAEKSHDQRLEELNRDLRFHRVHNAAPARLTAAQIDQYNQKGYIKNIRIFDDAQVTQNRDYFNQLLAAAAARGHNSYSINGWHARCQGLYELCLDPRIIACVRDILGDNIVAWGTHYFCKMPGDGKAVSWHQDASYWPLTPTRTVTAWLAIDDADPENGAMRVIPGSHLHGQIDFNTSEPGENNVLWQTVRNPERYGDSPTHMTMRAGEMSLHSDLLLHGSEPNHSTRRRCGLTIRYASTDVVAHWGWNQNAILCSGNDPAGHWMFPPKPIGDRIA